MVNSDDLVSEGEALSMKGKESSIGVYLQYLVLFIVWYAFNAGYNVYNAHSKVFPFPVTIAVAQLAIGLLYALPLWILGLRTPPKLTFSDIIELVPIAVMNAVGHVITVVAMFQKGGGSFVHVIKASEPVVSVLLGSLVTGSIPRPLTALSLLPISYGVAYASTLGVLNVETISKELATPTAIMAMIGNITVVCRSLLRKNISKEFKERTRLTAANDNAVITIMSVLFTVPLIFYFEDVSEMRVEFESWTAPKRQKFFLAIFICGMCCYIYNEMQNIVLGSLGPVSTAVGNTLKRVVIFGALYVFTEGETFPLPKIIGCAIAIAGCLAYAIFDSWKV